MIYKGIKIEIESVEDSTDFLVSFSILDDTFSFSCEKKSIGIQAAKNTIRLIELGWAEDEAFSIAGSNEVIYSKSGYIAEPIYCRTCGRMMRPIISDYLLDYRCPNEKWYNLFKHLPVAFLRIN